MATLVPSSGNIGSNYQAKPKAGVIAGAGGGTLLTVIANQLSEDSPWKPVLSYAAPSVAVFLSIFWRWIQTTLWRWIENEARNAIRTYRASKLSKKAKARLLSALKNSNTSEAHRKSIQEKLEKLETLTTNRDLKELEELYQDS
jgi:hypothetical protein